MTPTPEARTWRIAAMRLENGCPAKGSEMEHCPRSTCFNCDYAREFRTRADLADRQVPV